MERKDFLKLSSLGTIGMTLPNTFLIENTRDEQQIASNPQVIGEVTQDSAIFQTRLSTRYSLPKKRYDTPLELVSTDIPGVRGVARFEFSDNKNFKNSKKTSWQSAEAYNDYIIKAKVEGLNPGTLYFVKVHFGKSKDKTETGYISQFKTLPSEDSKGDITFAVSSCLCMEHFFLGRNFQGPNNSRNMKNRNKRFQTPAEGRDRELGYRSLEAMKKLNPEFLVQTGDNVYYDQPKEYKAQTQRELRAKWHRQMAQPRWNSLLRNLHCYFMVDDHDYRYNDSDNDVNHRPPSPQLARLTFREQVPVIDPDLSDDVTYRTRKINKYLQIWMMEGRQYRDTNTKPDGPNKTLWGKKQFEWLKKTLLSSTATFKVINMGTALIGPDDAYKHDSHVNYGGFRYERDIFFKWLLEHNFSKKNIYFITGDRHWQYHSIHPVTGFEEFATGTLTTENSRYGREPGDPDSTDPFAEIIQPYIQKDPIGGFLLLELRAPKNGTPATLTFKTIGENGEILNTEVKEPKKD